MNRKLRARLTPTLSVLIGSAMTLAPIIADAPMLPPFGLMMLLAWRLMRPPRSTFNAIFPVAGITIHLPPSIDESMLAIPSFCLSSDFSSLAIRPGCGRAVASIGFA